MPKGVYVRKAPTQEKTLARFWGKVNKTETCWLWIGAGDALGYGRFYFNGHLMLAHRFSYELAKGAVPIGLQLDHLWRVPACVNPDHLEAVTQSVNLKRGLTGKVNNPSTLATHCPHGHPYDELNTHVNRQGKRECRACHRENTRIRRGSIKRRASNYQNGGKA